MSWLKVYAENDGENFEEYSDFDAAAKKLADHGIVFERWKAEKELDQDATQEEVIAAYSTEVEKLKSRGYTTIDVASVHAGMENHTELRKKFLDEHTHGEDEIRFFVDGTGMFYVHHDGKVFMILCERGDLLNVPAGTKHWYDMGNKPSFKAIRFFQNPDGWVGTSTGDSIASTFPRYEQG